MIKCANCQYAAVYTVNDPAANSVDYCSSCIPRWLLTPAAEGNFALRSEGPKKDIVEDKPKSTKKKTEVPVEEDSVDEGN